MRGSPVIQETTRAIVVFPTPGSPSKRTARGLISLGNFRVNLESSVRISGFFKGRMIDSRICCLTPSYPAIWSKEMDFPFFLRFLDEKLLLLKKPKVLLVLRFRYFFPILKIGKDLVWQIILLL